MKIDDWIERVYRDALKSAPLAAVECLAGLPSSTAVSSYLTLAARTEIGGRRRLRRQRGREVSHDDRV